MRERTVKEPEAAAPTVALGCRAAFGGALMGLANLVPGISGGTMLLASGIYGQVIRAVSEVTAFRFRARSLLVLGATALAAALVIGLAAGSVKDLVVQHRWVMFSLFIGLTLGGIPVVWRMARPATPATWAGACGGLAFMALLTLAQHAGAGGAGGGSNPWLLFLAGLAAAGAMILPGVSGGYLLLLMGQYLPILSAIDRFKDAVRDGATAEAAAVALRVGLPVGLGVVAGIVGVSHLLRYLLERRRRATLGVLLGFLVGAVAGLWPFREGVAPRPGDVVKGRVMTEISVAALPPEDYPTVPFRPAPRQVVGALALALAGIGVTGAVARLGGEEPA